MGYSVYTITDSEGSGAEAYVIPQLGAWLFNYKTRNSEGDLVDIFHTDPELLKIWPKKIHCGSPILFPQAGPCSFMGALGQYAIGEEKFAMPQHGFARRSPWEIISSEKDSITMRLTHSDESLKSYPFEFLAELQYFIEKDDLCWRFSVQNQSQNLMPFSLGFHPYFKVSNGMDRFLVHLPEGKRAIPDESIESWIFRPESRTSLAASLDLSGTYFRTGIDPKSRSAMIEDTHSGMLLELDFKLAPYFDTLATWSPDPGAPYICVEPWSALPNALNSKNGIIELEPGMQWSGHFKIHVVNKPNI